MRQRHSSERSERRESSCITTDARRHCVAGYDFHGGRSFPVSGAKRGIFMHNDRFWIDETLGDGSTVKIISGCCFLLHKALVRSNSPVPEGSDVVLYSEVLLLRLNPQKYHGSVVVLDSGVSVDDGCSSRPVGSEVVLGSPSPVEDGTSSTEVVVVISPGGVVEYDSVVDSISGPSVVDGCVSVVIDIEDSCHFIRRYWCARRCRCHPRI